MEVCPRPSSGPGVENSFKPDPLHRFNAAATDQPANRFECDGRTHCSQMRSCAEAGCFLRTAPTQRWMEIETANLVSGSRSEEHTSELQSLMRISYAVFCLKKKNSTSISTHLHNI